MRVRITAACVDIITQKPYNVGDVVELPDARALDAIGRNLAAPIAEPKTTATKAKRTTTKAKSK